MAAPLEGVVALKVPRSAPQPARLVAEGQLAAEEEPPKNCELCNELGRVEAATTHSLETCYTYPHSSRFRENVWRMRKRELDR